MYLQYVFEKTYCFSPIFKGQVGRSCGKYFFSILRVSQNFFCEGDCDLRSNLSVSPSVPFYFQYVDFSDKR